MTAALEATAQPLANSLRQQIAKVAPDHADIAIATLVEAMKATKTGSGMCRKCGTRVEVRVQDANAATNALKLLIEQTEGRPGVAEEAERDQIVIQRLVAAPEHPANTALEGHAVADARPPARVDGAAELPTTAVSQAAC